MKNVNNYQFINVFSTRFQRVINIISNFLSKKKPPLGRLWGILRDFCYSSSKITAIICASVIPNFLQITFTASLIETASTIVTLNVSSSGSLQYST
jgi:hypothetical protein